MAEVYLTIEPAQVSIRHRWRTQIMTTAGGAEQRSALYSWPRVALAAKYKMATSSHVNWFKRNLVFSTDAIWGVPVWPDMTALTAQAASGQKTLAVAETAYRRFYAGRELIIIAAADPVTYEVCGIDTVAAQEITLSENLVATWPAGSRVLPLYDCRIGAEQSVEMTRTQSLEIDAQEAFEEARSFAYTPPDSGAEEYEGLDIFSFYPQKPLALGYRRPYDIAQWQGLAYAQSRYATGENKMSFSADYVFPTRAEIASFWNFFDAHMGRLSAFWLPSHGRDIVPAAAVGAEETRLTIEPISYASTYFTNELQGRHIYARLPGAAGVCRKITGAGADYIDIDSALGFAVSAAQCARVLISFLYLARFDLDEAEMLYPHNRPDFGRAALSFSALIGEELEEA